MQQQCRQCLSSLELFTSIFSLPLPLFSITAMGPRCDFLVINLYWSLCASRAWEFISLRNSGKFSILLVITPLYINTVIFLFLFIFLFLLHVHYVVHCCTSHVHMYICCTSTLCMYYMYITCLIMYYMYIMFLHVHVHPKILLNSHLSSCSISISLEMFMFGVIMFGVIWQCHHI